MLVDTILN